MIYLSCAMALIGSVLAVLGSWRPKYSKLAVIGSLLFCAGILIRIYTLK